jgi:two-component system response regulator DevR
MALEVQAEARQQPSMRVFLIDDEIVIRTGLRILINSWPASQVVGEANGPAEALAGIDEIKPNVIVCSHPARSNGFLESIRKLIKGAGKVPVVLLSGSLNPRLHARAIRAGAKWIVSRHHAAAELQKALERVHSGEEWRKDSENIMRHARVKGDGSPKNHRVSDLDRRLTKREREVAIMVSEGCTNRQVGERLGITEVTVRHHLSSIFNKLSIGNRYELITWLYRTGIVKPGEMAERLSF